MAKEKSKKNKKDLKNESTVKEAKIVETKTVEKKQKKGSKNTVISELKNNTPFLILLCVVVILTAALILLAYSKKVPKTSDGDYIVASVKGKDITANDLYEALKEKNGSDALMHLIDTYIAEKEVKITEEDEKYVKEVVDYYKEYAEYYKTDLATFLANYVIYISGIETTSVSVFCG